MVFSANHVINLSRSPLAASELNTALLHSLLPGVISAYLKASTVPFTYIAFLSTGEAQTVFSLTPKYFVCISISTTNLT